MAEVDDMQLLRDFAENGSEAAFAELVKRHLNMVHSAALRRVGNAQDAEDVTQVVFLILARKAKNLSPRTVVAGWLYEATRFTSKRLLRARLRREVRQREVAMQSVNSEVAPEDTWSRIAPLLEQGMEKLSANERAILVMRYFENKSAAETADVLGIGEWATHKRTVRAVDKLRQFFSKNGVTLTSVIVVAAISGNSVRAAPIGFTGTVTTTAMKGLAVGSSVSGLVKGTLKFMAWSKLKMAAAAVAAIVVASGTAIVAVETIRPSARGSSSSAAVDKIWDEYYRVFTKDLKGPDMREAVVRVMTNHPPMALIRLTRLPRLRQSGPSRVGRISGMRTAEGCVETADYMAQVLRYAYGLDARFPQYRIIVPPEFATNRYDFIDTMPSGGREVLRQAIKDQFGLVARSEMRGNLILTVKNPAAGGLHRYVEGDVTAADKFTSSNITMTDLAHWLSKPMGVEVTDQTGLTGKFAYSLDIRHPPTPDDIKKALLEQLGLELSPAPDVQQFEFLVAEKVK